MKAILILALLMTTPAFAEWKGPVDPTIAAWFHKLYNPVMKIHCCDMADCEEMQVKGDGHGGFLANLPNFGWTPIPPQAILEHQDNPTGENVVCHVDNQIFCFESAPLT